MGLIDSSLTKNKEELHKQKANKIQRGAVQMIDYLTILSDNIKIDEKNFSPLRWRKITNKHNKYYLHRCNSVDIRYYPNKTMVLIKGKISTLFLDSQVKNVDDIFRADTERFIDSVNERLRILFETDIINIRTFKVVRIDYCYNVKTPYVTEYLEFMSAAFQHKNKGRRTDFTYERGLSGSLYIKPTGEYQKNQKKSYCLNFYDKTDWIRNQEEKRIYISEEDKKLAADVFRLEVQCYSDKIKRICEKHKIDNSFGNLCNISLAYNTICEVYKTLFGGDENCFYVKYEETKIIKFTPIVRQQLISSAQHHDITPYSAKEAIKRNIYPYYFLPSKGIVKRLENPIMLICDKIEAMLSSQ